MRGQPHAPAALYPGKDPVPIAQEAGWAPGPVWTVAENLAPTGIRSPDRPARSQSLYQPRYPAHLIFESYTKICDPLLFGRGISNDRFTRIPACISVRFASETC